METAPSTSINSGDDYFIDISLHGFHHLSAAKKSGQIHLTANVQVLLQSSSSSSSKSTTPRIKGYTTTEEFLLQPNNLFSEECRDAMTILIKLMYIPFSLDDDEKHIQWTSSYGKFVKGNKSLKNSEDLVIELERYFQNLKYCLPPYQDLRFKFNITKEVTLPDDEFKAWKYWSENYPCEYDNFTQIQPGLDQRLRRAVLVELDRFRVGKGGGETQEGLREQCPICLEELLNGGDGRVSETIRLHPCDHVYHEICILEWLKINKSCPYCRANCTPNK
ncbi:hypothetical protein BUALT_Bualt02G0038200 [Buddleja alternifolia]|uniref:RING-type domain-containing protein n=1 Tax=Buddleja alternifolia TaxID=168488 RepID=A0AAV6Y3Y9_9LAMI|nr:hypothetical protein BUALT_Bualt02G0038200 [Buddleja alternifolia]